MGKKSSVGINAHLRAILKICPSDSSNLIINKFHLVADISFSKHQQAVQYNLTLYSPLSEQQIFDQHRKYQTLNLHYNRKNGSFIYVISLIPNCPTVYLIMVKRTSLINMASPRTLFFLALFVSILLLFIFIFYTPLPYHYLFL